jgi:Ras GTPase-activating-like protein IQGAP2/3
MRYLQAIDDSTREPLKPLSNQAIPNGKLNKPIGNQEHRSQDLDVLAKQLYMTSPDKGDLLKKFETNSATVSSFRSPLNRSSTTSSNGSPSKRPNLNFPVNDTSEEPEWANKNYKDLLRKSPNRSSPIKLMSSGSKLTPLKLDGTKKSQSPYFSSPGNSTSTESPGYEYLCRIQAIKNWLQIVLDEPIQQSAEELIDYIRNGIYLAKLANVILPSKKLVFLNDSKLQFRHTENINRFFQLLDYLNVPDLFRFESTDLYDAKNVPKVWFCLHAITYMVKKMDNQVPSLENLVDTLQFSEEEIRKANRSLVGTGLPQFESADTGEPITRHTFIPTIKPLQKEAFNRQDLSPVRKGNFSVNNQPTLQDTKSDFAEKYTSGTRLFQNEIEQQKANKEDGNAKLNDLQIQYGSYSAALENFEPQIIKLQSLSRGANFRYKMFVDKIILKSFSEELNDFMAICRGNISRSRTVHIHRDEVNVYKSKIIELQAICRMKMLRTRLKKTEEISIQSIINLQSLIRAKSVKTGITKKKLHFLNNEHRIIDLQSQIRMKLIFHKVNTVLENKLWLEPSMLKFQSVCRSQLYRRTEHKNTISNGSYGLVELQSLLRGCLLRSSFRQDLYKMNHAVAQIKELQSIARGGISRTRLCNSVLINLLCEDDNLNDLFAIVRGKNLRKQVQGKKEKMKAVETISVVPMQTLFRGIYARFNREVILEDIYENVTKVIELQAMIRGRQHRAHLGGISKYYNDNVEKVIVAQSIIRAKLLQKNYISLLNLKNPPLSVIREFAYLLTDNDIDYQELMELSDLKDRIVDISKHNESLESQIESLDLKLSLLDKNRITVEEFVRNKKIPRQVRANATSASNSFGNLNKSSKKRIELFESIFFLLQTKPIYFIRLFKSMDINSKNSALCKNLQNYIVLLFPIKDASIDLHEREEYFFLKLVYDIMEVDMQMNCSKVSEITKIQNCFWIDYFLHLNNHTYQRQHLKSLLGNFVSHIIESDEVDFELDPVAIYDGIIENELNLNGSATKSKKVSPQTAIKNADVSNKFIQNLMSLRETSTELLNLLHRVVNHVPLHVKLICKQAFILSQKNFPDKPEEQHLAVAGVIFFKHYISIILQCPENFGYLIKDPFNPTLFHAKSRDNLKSLNRVMLQVFSLKPFSDNYLKPMNDFVVSSKPATQVIIRQVLDVKDIESEMKMNDYNDIVTHERPQLTINMNNLILLERILTQNIDVMAPGADDQLYGLMTQASNILNSAGDIVALTELGYVTLSLNPTTKEDSLADSKSRSLFTEVKRCILYIIRIQAGEDLLELLISPIKPKDEACFRRIVKEEMTETEQSSRQTKRRPYYRSSLSDLNSLTLHELKKMALEKLLKLESMHLITRADSFQTILNEIGIDIKTKHTQRNSRKTELKIANDTVSKLSEKEKLLQRQLSDYNKHVESILSQIHLVPKEKRIFSIIPVFSKQYFYHRELRKQNRLPKFGSYKYSAKKLMEQKVVLDFGGLINRAYSSSSKLDFMFSCHKVGTFTIEAATGAVAIPGALKVLTLDDLLNLQFEHQLKIDLFDGMAVFDSENLIGLIFRKFYETKKD